ncbi:SRPBCC family protein [Calothrix sp. NIES-2098]|uniref:SRPBCC family protein n=1 Tax=Calothrix sp. NIES-2098 TaxID=1954171 RepID=UPI000B5FC8AC|nr:hypothetical protein NIES2098_27220 [Calothrix sp. NIES-2098]
MANYSFLTIWEIETPIDKVWDVIIHSERWPSWWKAVESVVEIEAGEASLIGNIRRFTWQTPLSYKLTFDGCVTRIEPPKIMKAVASGELEGVGLWELEEVDGVTTVSYTWTVTTTKPWMNALALFIRPLMEWNHHEIMRQGGEGIAQLLSARLISNLSQKSTLTS